MSSLEKEWWSVEKGQRPEGRIGVQTELSSARDETAAAEPVDYKRRRGKQAAPSAREVVPSLRATCPLGTLTELTHQLA